MANEGEDNAEEGADKAAAKDCISVKLVIISSELLTQQRRRASRERCRQLPEQGQGRSQERRRRAKGDRSILLLRVCMKKKELAMMISATSLARIATVTLTPPSVKRRMLTSTPTRAWSSPIAPVKTIFNSSTRGVTCSTVQFSLVI